MTRIWRLKGFTSYFKTALPIRKIALTRLKFWDCEEVNRSKLILRLIKEVSGCISKKSKRGNNRTKHSLVNDHDQPPNGSQRNKDICLGFVAFISLLTFSLLIYTLVELHSLSVHHDALNDEISRMKLSTELLRKSVKRQGVDYNLMNMGETALR